MEMIKVVFQNKNDEKRGYSLLLHKGTIVYTGKKGKFIVPKENLEMLKKAGISFETEPIKK